MSNYNTLSKSTYLLLLVSFLATLTKADPVTLEGYVIDKESNDPLIGVSVALKNSIYGTITDYSGKFVLKVNDEVSIILIMSYIGYTTVEYKVESVEEKIRVELTPQALMTEEIIISASRVEESIARSPVAIEKLDAKDIRQSTAPSLFDALENVKGISFTTSSLGLKVPNARGFNNTTNPRFTQLVDGIDNQAPGLGIAVGNMIGPNELDIESIEVLPGASSALYGMNALNGMISMKTKSPFLYPGFSVYQKIGVNHVDGKEMSPQLMTESAFRYAENIKDRFAFKFNFAYLKGTDWVANDLRDLNPYANASTGLYGSDNPGFNPINSYGNENSNRRNLLLANKIYEVRRTGYLDREVTDYEINNLKADVSLHYRINSQLEASYAFKLGESSAIYNRGNRVGLEDFVLQQHKVELNAPEFQMRAYYIQENSGDSYNFRPMAENLDRSFKSDDAWFTDYQNQFLQSLNNGINIADAHREARTFADAGRYEAGTELFEAQQKKLGAINNWDEGAWLLMKNSIYHAEAQYQIDKISGVDVLIGADIRSYGIYPDGNSFINNEKPGERFYYTKVGGFVQASRTLLHEKLKLLGSLRADKIEFFEMKFNPRFAAVYTLQEKHNFRFAYQNGFRFPSIFEGFSYVNNGGVRRLGGFPIMSEKDRIFENAYVRSTVDEFSGQVIKDVNQFGLSKEEAAIRNKDLLVVSDYTYLQPEQINAFDLGYKGSFLNNKLSLDADVYYNIYRNFIDQLEVAVPKVGQIGDFEGEIDPTIFYMTDRNDNERYRMWTNSKSTTYNYGSSLGIYYNLLGNYVMAGNVSYARLHRSSSQDPLEAAFNTPTYITNLSFGNRKLFQHFGFNLSWRWQDAFEWRLPLANGIVPAYHTLDAQLNYTLPDAHLLFKIGASNLLNQYYTQYVGGPSIGGLYYLSLTFDPFSVH